MIMAGRGLSFREKSNCKRRAGLIVAVQKQVRTKEKREASANNHQTIRILRRYLGMNERGRHSGGTYARFRRRKARRKRVIFIHYVTKTTPELGQERTISMIVKPMSKCQYYRYWRTVKDLFRSSAHVSCLNGIQLAVFTFSLHVLAVSRSHKKRTFSWSHCDERSLKKSVGFVDLLVDVEKFLVDLFGSRPQ